MPAAAKNAASRAAGTEADDARGDHDPERAAEDEGAGAVLGARHSEVTCDSAEYDDGDFEDDETVGDAGGGGGEGEP